MTTCIAALGFLFLSAIALLQQLLDRSKSMEQEHRINLEEYNDQLEAEVGLREQKLKEKNSLLEQSNLELEEKNTLLRLSYKRMDDLRQQQEALLKQAALIKGDVLQDLEGEGLALLAEPNKAHLQRIGVLSHRLSSVLEPFSRLYEDIEAVSNKSIWVMEGKTSAEPFYRHTLGSSKVNLQFFQNEETLMHSLERERPHLLILDADFLEIAAHIHQRYPETPFLISSHGDLSLYIDQLELQTYLNHIFSRDDVDAAFTQRDLLVTATKILSNDLFGLEKYLNWGVDVKEHIITGSLDRLEVLPKLEKDLERAGLPSAMIRAAHRISDELLMNAIYDAPIDRVSGLSRYNHLSRRVNIELEPSEYARLRYAFDGSILAVSIDDPFGGLRRDIILRYLKSCFDGKFGLINETEGKGGGGMGLFQIISTADLLVTNVKPGAKTEVIALLFVHARGTGTRSKGRSFHYFVER